MIKGCSCELRSEVPHLLKDTLGPFSGVFIYTSPEKCGRESRTYRLRNARNGNESGVGAVPTTLTVAMATIHKSCMLKGRVILWNIWKAKVKTTHF